MLNDDYNFKHIQECCAKQMTFKQIQIKSNKIAKRESSEKIVQTEPVIDPTRANLISICDLTAKPKMCCQAQGSLQLQRVRQIQVSERQRRLNTCALSLHAISQPIWCSKETEKSNNNFWSMIHAQIFKANKYGKTAATKRRENA